MTKPQLRLLAIVLIGLIALVLAAGLDNLPRHLRADITSEQQALSTAEKQLQKARAEVGAGLRAEPDLFRVRSMDTALAARLAKAENSLQAAQRDMRTLAGYAKANRRTDRAKVESLLREERKLRSGSTDESSAASSDARHWLDLKNHLPEQVAQMSEDHEALRRLDLLKLTAAVQKAENDWPEKRADLESRLVAVISQPAQAEPVWQSSSELRRKVAANDLAGLDYAALISAADTLHQARVDVPRKAAELEAMSGQLYDAWDKILVDLDVQRGGDLRYYKEKIRTVRTHFTDVAAKQTQTTSDEGWVEVSPTQYQSVQNDLGMAIEHKSAGKYDSEGERVAQPAGFAYIATPAQGSNQYGYWDHRGGQSVWTWLPQYLILRELLWNRYSPPITTYEYNEYRSTWSRGRTYYGQETYGGSTAPKYGTSGTFTQRRYADSNYARGGGYKDSRYANQGGGYKGSRYESPASRSGQGQEPRTFGRQDSRNSGSGQSFGQGSHSSPRPRSAPSGGGRSFGGRRR
jgi:hypothetical protein